MKRISKANTFYMQILILISISILWYNEIRNNYAIIFNSLFYEREWTRFKFKQFVFMWPNTSSFSNLYYEQSSYFNMVLFCYFANYYLYFILVVIFNFMIQVELCACTSIGLVGKLITIQNISLFLFFLVRLSGVIPIYGAVL